MFSHMVFLFYFFIFQNYICWFYFFNIKQIENLIFLIFFFKKLLIATVFIHMIFFLWFSSKLSFLFYFLILSWLIITITIFEGSTTIFLINYCELLQCFFPRICFPKIILVNFIFLILSWLRIAITSKYK